MTAKDSDENQKSEIPEEKFEGKDPAARPGNDRDMGNSILFVASNQYLNGPTVAIDGEYLVATGT